MLPSLCANGLRNVVIFVETMVLQYIKGTPAVAGRTGSYVQEKATAALALVRVHLWGSPTLALLACGYEWLRLIQALVHGFLGIARGLDHRTSSSVRRDLSPACDAVLYAVTSRRVVGPTVPPPSVLRRVSFRATLLLVRR